MRIYMNELVPEGLLVEGDLPPEIMEATENDPVTVAGPIHCRLRAMDVTGELIVEGELSASLAFRCRRCDGTFASTLDKLPYHYNQALESAPEYVDLTNDIREAMILAFPLYPVCRPDCKGLCPQCGADKNETECDCKPPAENRWAALSGLK